MWGTIVSNTIEYYIFYAVFSNMNENILNTSLFMIDSPVHAPVYIIMFIAHTSLLILAHKFMRMHKFSCIICTVHSWLITSEITSKVLRSINTFYVNRRTKTTTSKVSITRSYQWNRFVYTDLLCNYLN